MSIDGLLVKWLNTLPSQGSIHGFEFHTGHHKKNKSLTRKDFLFYFKNNYRCGSTIILTAESCPLVSLSNDS